jgi:hypothetical protein
MLDYYRSGTEAGNGRFAGLAAQAKLQGSGLVAGITHDELSELWNGWSGGELRLCDAVDQLYSYERWSTYNGDAKWDWYQIGGRWTGYFKLKPGKKGKLGEPGIMTAEAQKGYADQALKRDIDLQGMRDDAGYAADKRWHEIHAIVDPLPAFDSWERVRDLHADDADKARDAYHAQPAVKALADAKVLGFTDTIDRYMVPLDQFVQAARDGAIAPYAFVHKGRWVESGQMGWFGLSSNQKAQGDWSVEFNAMLDALPGNTLLTCVDCHI